MDGNSAAAAYNGMVTPTINPDAPWVGARSQFFRVDVFGVSLGMFSKVEGLGAQVAIEKREEGGTNGYVYQLPGRVTYPNIKVTRPVNQHSTGIAMLFSAMNDPKFPRTASITAIDTLGAPMAAWNMIDVVLVQWQGPSFTTESASLATETLEFAHHGFAAP
jgi:phage tail-like protein